MTPDSRQATTGNEGKIKYYLLEDLAHSQSKTIKVKEIDFIAKSGMLGVHVRITVNFREDLMLSES